MTVADAGRRPGGRTRSRETLRQPDLRRFVGFVLAGVVAAVVTGPEGRTGQPTYALTQSMHPGHLFEWIGIFVGLWVLVTAWLLGRPYAQPTVDRVRQSGRDAFGHAFVRYALYAALLVVAIVIPRQYFGEYWQEVAVTSIGIYALLAIGLNVVVGFAGLLDLGYIA